MRKRKLFRTSLILLTVFPLLALSLFVSSAQIGIAPKKTPPNRPSEIDVRGPFGVPKGTQLRAPTGVQLKAIGALEGKVGKPLQVEYNGLTATPRQLFSYGTYLTQPSSEAPETIARNFLSQWRAIFRFSDDDLRNLKLKSRATLPDLGTTVLLFEQTRNNLPVYKGEVLVNVNRNGQIMSIGGENFPQMNASDAFTLTPAQAIQAGANSLGITNFAPQSLGTKKVVRTYGDLPREYVDGTRFSGGGVFTDEIVVTRTIFPLGDEGRPAYQFMLTTPQYEGIMWNNVVDAQTGVVLRRTSLTSFVGPSGGGQGVGRRATFRPDIQNMIEAFNAGSTAVGKVFDAAPTALSGVHGFGRSTRTGLNPATYVYTSPTYAPESPLPTDANGRGFRYSLVQARNEDPLKFPSTPTTFSHAQLPDLLSQVLRGLPDATNPSASSPFGWFYLPTNNGGAEITASNGNRATTRAFGYTISDEAKARNLASNSPAADKSQPFSATVTPLSGSTTLQDGRVLSSVIQSNYTEGNNVVVADDHADDDEATHGIKGYSPNRHFDASYFDYINSYEYGGTDAGGSPFFPATTNADVYPGTVSLFFYTNLMHDYLYSIGFTEATWNFQQDNFGKGGSGGDALSAQVQDGSGTDNANMGTPNDGSAPRMQMYLFTEDGFRRSDGSFDFDVVSHEFYHGVSNRSAGKGQTDCLGTPLVGESGGMGEGWSDFIASSMTDDDSEGEYVTGEFDIGIRRLPYTNYRWSYGSINGTGLNRRDNRPLSPQVPDAVVGAIPFEVHDVGEVWAATLWDMRELMIVKQKVNSAFPGVFFDGARRLGNGTTFYIGERQVQSVDANHPIDYRASFGDTAGTTPTINASNHIVRPGLLAAEIASNPSRTGPLATAVSNGARIADTITLRGLQLAPCNPSFVDMRNSMLLADTELTGGENRAVIWRAFASHGVGALAQSSTSGTGAAGAVVEDFSVPADVATCETAGPLPAPSFSLSTPSNNAVRVTIPSVTGAATKIISRASSANGPYTKIAEIPNSQATYDDNDGGAGLPGGQTVYYQVRVTRNPECVSTANTDSIIVTGPAVTPAPVFSGLDQVQDPGDGTRLILSWLPAVSLNPSANIVYDIYRVTAVPPSDSTQDPTFTPSASNRITPPSGVTGNSYVDTGNVGQIYYYIVQARDTNNGKVDTNNTGNRVTKWNAPTVSNVSGAPPFPLDTFESSADSSDFTPPLTESGTNPNQDSQTFQRTNGANQSGLGQTDGKMYAPDFSPGDEQGLPDPAGTRHGGQSDFSTIIGPFSTANGNSLTQTSIMQFDNFINAEATFDGGVIEIGVGAPPSSGASTPFPDNTTTYDAGDYMIEGYYNGHLDGLLPAGGAYGSSLQGRRAFTGIKGLHRVRVALGSFAPGGVRNPNGLPVYIRFRMTSDVATANGLDAGWYIDNLVINNLACHVNVAAASAGATASASSEYPNGGFPASSAINGDRKGENWGGGTGGWNDGTRDAWSDSLEVNFNGAQTINEIRVYTLQNDFKNPVEPNLLTPADVYGISDFDVQYWNGSAWATVTGGSVTGNDKAMRVFVFPDLTTSKIRVLVNGGRVGYSRITEVEAFGCSAQ